MWNSRAVFYIHFGICLWILSGGRSQEAVHRRSLDQAKSSSNVTCINCQAGARPTDTDQTSSTEAQADSPAAVPKFGNTTTASTKSSSNVTCINCQALVLKKENQTVSQGDEVMLKCTVSTAQPINFTWIRNGVTLTSTSDAPIRRTKGKSGSRLKIRAAKLVDGGTYMCLAYWSDGKLAYSNKAYVLVQAKSGARPTDTDQTSSTEAQADSPATVPKFGNTTTASTNFVMPTRQPGYCVPYTGELCSRILKRGKEIFVDHHSPQPNIEKKLVGAFKVISTSGQLSEQCKPYVLPLLCHYWYPYCDKAIEGPTPRSLCRDECDYLSKDICSSEYHIAQRQDLIGDVLLPDCSKLPPTKSPGWERCISLHIQKYTSPSIRPRKADKCFNGTGEGYRGNKSLTKKGRICQAWNRTKPHFHLFSPSKFPELRGGHNFCRNPGGNKKRPWCYTTDEKILYDYCNIERCDQPPAIKLVSILYTVIPCLVFGIIVGSVVILICWRCHKQMLYQANQSATPLVPVIMKTVVPTTMKELRREKVTFRKDLGEGQFGKVYHGELTTEYHGRRNTSTVLIKSARSTPSSALNKREEFIKQAEVWSNFDHPNIIKVLGMYTKGTPASVVYEFLECGTLHGYLLRHSPLEDPDDCCKPDCLSSSDLLSIAVQVAAGMNYLTNNAYIHGDIATRNCMVGPRRTVKITDIPLSWDPYAHEYHWEHNKLPMPIRWMAPEGVLLSKFTVETDIWSFGVLLWELFSYGAQPHFGYTDDEVIERIREHVILPCPKNCPAWVYSLMKECWDILPPSRPRFITIHTSLCALQRDYDNRIIT